MKNPVLSLFAVAAVFAATAVRAQDTPPGFEVLYRTTDLSNYVLTSAPLLLSSDGNFYGTTQLGGVNETGSLFKFTLADKSVSVLYGFSKTTTSYPYTNPDGRYPFSTPVQDDTGDFLGTTPSGGPSANGIIYKIAPDGAYTKMHAFDHENGRGVNFDGCYPKGGLVRGSDGNFYGTNSFGGPNGTGTVFRIAPDRRYSVIYSFSGLDSNRHNADGVAPTCTLAVGQDGNFYGTTSAGGADNSGTVFRVTPAGVFTTLCSFSRSSSAYNPSSGVIQGSDGNFYGMTDGVISGSSFGNGAIYKVTPAGALTIVHEFSADDSGGIKSNGYAPRGLLMQAKDGNFYGIANGGANKFGQIFRLTADGVFTTVLDFTTTTGAGFGGLTQGSDGRLYGTASNGNNGFDNSIYAVTIAPVINSPATATAEVGRPFSYQITASNSPTSYRVPGLPPGLTFNTKTGLIKGTPTKAGTYNATLQAINANGTASSPLVVTVQAQGVPFITSSLTASGVRGQPFSYQITADYNPTHFGAVGLPGGLHIDANTGLISGTPTGFATYHVTLKASNAQGTATATLTLTIIRQ